MSRAGSGGQDNGGASSAPASTTLGRRLFPRSAAAVGLADVLGIVMANTVVGNTESSACLKCVYYKKLRLVCREICAVFDHEVAPHRLRLDVESLPAGDDARRSALQSFFGRPCYAKSAVIEVEGQGAPWPHL